MTGTAIGVVGYVTGSTVVGGLPGTVLGGVGSIEEHHRCFGLGGYFMAALMEASSYSRIGFSLCLAVRARRVMVPGGSVFHLEPGKIHPCWNLTGTSCI